MLICFLDVRDKMGDPGVVKAGINAAPYYRFKCIIIEMYPEYECSSP